MSNPITIADMIKILQAMPQDALVATPHYWDVDDDQLDLLDAESLRLMQAGGRRDGVIYQSEPGQTVLVIS
jgi:hypothetical protein